MNKTSPTWFFLASRLLKREKNFSFALILCLTIGMTGYVVLESLQTSLTEHLTKQSKKILGADLAISARRDLSSKEKKIIKETMPSQTQYQIKKSIFTMVGHKGKRTLFQIVGVDHKSFPFYQGLILQENGLVDSNTTKKLNKDSACWISKGIHQRYKLNIGDYLDIGETSCKISDIIKSDPSEIVGSSGFAQRIIISLDLLRKTKLLTKKSLVTTQNLYLFPKEKHAATELIRENLLKDVKASDLKVLSPKQSSFRNNRIIVYINDYMSLISIIAYLLSLIGVLYLFRSLMYTHSKDLTILKALGAKSNLFGSVYISVIVGITIIAVLMSAILAYFFLPIFQNMIANFLPDNFIAKINLKSLVTTLFISLTGSILVSLPILQEIKKRSTSLLLKSKAKAEFFAQSNIVIFSFLNVIFYWLLAVRASSSYFVGSLFILSILMLLVITICFFFLMTKILSRATEKQPIYNLAFKSITRKKLPSISFLLAIATVSMLFSLVPQISYLSEKQLEPTSKKDQASLFLFDIQEDDLDSLVNGLRSWEKKNHIKRSVLINTSPMISAKLVGINGEVITAARFKNATQTREDEFRRRMENRQFRLTYRDKLLSSEKVVAGKSKEDYLGKLPAISLERRFAQRLNIKLEDTLSFEINGETIKGKVINFRKVNWTSFHPNFFISFYSGTLNGFYKTFIGATRTSEKETASLQNWIGNNFPHISTIDTSSVVKQFNELLEQVLFMIKIISILVLIIGFLVVIGICLFQNNEQKIDFSVQKAVGFSAAQLQKIEAIKVLTLSSISAFTGCFTSIFCSWLVSKYILKNDFSLLISTPLIVFCLLTATTTIISILLTRKYFSTQDLSDLHTDAY